MYAKKIRNVQDKFEDNHLFAWGVSVYIMPKSVKLIE